MSDLRIEEVTHERAFASNDGRDSFCHILDGSGTRFYCGRAHPTGRCSCGEYLGEGICPVCGQVTCPQCAVLADLDERIGKTNADV